MRSGKSDLVDVEGEIKRETEKAYLIDNGSVEEWVPKSQCEWNQDEGTFTMPEYIAKEKGLI